MHKSSVLGDLCAGNVAMRVVGRRDSPAAAGTTITSVHVPQDSPTDSHVPCLGSP